MNTSLSHESIAPLLARLAEANLAFTKRYPGEGMRRQPVHTVYGGGHLWKYDTAPRLGALALQAVDRYAPDFVTFAKAIRIPGADRLPDSPHESAALVESLEDGASAVRGSNEPAWLAHAIYTRVLAKLRREPVEDFRIDFEDGYGNRPDAEEDGHAVAAASEVARGAKERTLPPFIGIRVKPLTEELRARSLRTLDLFVTTVLEECGGALPPGFVLTLPKVQVPEQVEVFAAVLELLERRFGLADGALVFEMMIEQTQAVFGRDGAAALPSLVDAARGRCVGAHLGTYDYTASCSITAAHQNMAHPACDFAKNVMQVTLAGTGIALSDGATNVMPVGPHRGASLTLQETLENRAAVHGAWRLHVEHVHHSLVTGYYQGWDLHPAQLPTRFAAVYSFFLESLAPASERLRNFVDKAAQATLVGDVFDDAATGQGLLNFFLRGLGCGAITEEEALATGLALDEIRLRSFAKIVAKRRSPVASGGR